MMAMPARLPTNTSKYFLNPQPAGPSPPEEYLYGRSAPFQPPTAAPAFAATPPPQLPMAHTPPSHDVSPTNNFNVPFRQLRQPRQPLYIPAALRPTELPAGRDIPNRPRPLDTPPASFDSVKADSPTTTTTPSLTWDLSREDAHLLSFGPGRRTSDALTESTGIVTGPPTNAHWKPDASSDTCSVCNVAFTWYFRRHHCRRCGSLVCENHSKRSVPLDQNARFHARGHKSKACNPCHDEWKYLQKLHRRHSRASSLADSWVGSHDTAVPAILIPQQAQRVADELRVGSMARSEGGMVWSTF